MDRRRSSQEESEHIEKELVVESREDTCVPNTPVLAALTPTSPSPSEASPAQSINLNDLEKGQSEAVLASSSDSRIRRHFQDEVSSEWYDIVLLLCWFTTGFLDSTIFNGTPEHTPTPPVGIRLKLTSNTSIWNFRIDADRYVDWTLRCRLPC